MNPSVSIITVVCNGSSTINDCLRSINIQTVPAEHIIVDGASTDNTLDIVREISPHARILSEPDHGIYDAINKGIRMAKGETIGASLVRPADFMYVYQSITIGLTAAVNHHLRRVPFFIDTQDHWPDFLPATGMINNPRGIRIIGRWCDFVYSQASKMTTLSHGFKNAIVARRVPDDKVEVIYN